MRMNLHSPFIMYLYKQGCHLLKINTNALKIYLYHEFWTLNGQHEINLRKLGKYFGHIIAYLAFVTLNLNLVANFIL
jgi:hypothetical protein